MRTSPIEIILLPFLAIILAIALFLYGYFILGYLTGQQPHFWDDSPYEYPGTTWISDNPEILLVIPEENVTIQGSEAWLVSNNEKVDICINMDARGSLVDIRPAGLPMSPLRLIVGEKTNCTKDRLVFDVVEDHVFDGEFKQITMYRKKDD